MADYQTKLKSNIWKFFVFEVLWSLVFFFPIFQLFLLARNMNIFDIAILGMVWLVARMVAEIPSGVLADRWGRKRTLFLSQIFLISEMILTIFSQSFWIFMVTSILSGFWFACYSGTGVAFFYDTLLELKREKEYERLWGKLGLITSVVSFIAAFSAGFLFSIGIILPYLFSAISAFFSLLIILSFTEPQFHKPAEEFNLFLHFKESVKKVVKNEYIAFIVLFGAILSFSLEYLFSYGQIYLKSISIPVIFFGIIFAFRSIIDGVGSFSANKVKNRFSYRSIFTFILLFSVITIFILSFIGSFFGVFVFLLLFLITGLFRIIQRGYIHKRVESFNRATVDSMSTFAMSIFAIIFEPIAGFIAFLFSIRLSFFLLGCILTIYSIYYFITKFRKKQLYE